MRINPIQWVLLQINLDLPLLILHMSPPVVK